MVTVPSKELKNRLGKYLRMVRAGEAVRVTDRGRPIACILPADDQFTGLLSALVARGSLTPGGGRLARTARPAVLKPGKSIADMVAEDRR